MRQANSAYSLELARLAYGMALLAAPRQLAGAVTGAPVSANTITVMRVLGARHVIQAAVTVRSGRRLRAIASGVDLLHLASLGPIGVACDRRQRRLVTADAAVEASFAAAEAALS